MYWFLCEHIFSSFLDNSQEVWLLDFVSMFNFVRTTKLSSPVVIPFGIPTNKEWEFLLLHILASNHLVLLMFQILAILIAVHLFLVAVLICIFLMPWCGASFHIAICCLYIFFGDVSVKVFGLFFIWVVYILIVKF